MTMENMAEYSKKEKYFYRKTPRKCVLSSCPRNGVYIVCIPLGLF